MSTAFSAETPRNAVSRLSELEDAELLSFFRSLPWKMFLKNHVNDLSLSDAKELLKMLVVVYES